MPFYSFPGIQNAFAKSVGFDCSPVTDGNINGRCRKLEKTSSKLCCGSYAVTIPASNVKTRAEIKVTYWLRQKAINVSVGISTLEAKKWTTVNAPPNAGHCRQPSIHHKAAVVD